MNFLEGLKKFLKPTWPRLGIFLIITAAGLFVSFMMLLFLMIPHCSAMAVSFHGGCGTYTPSITENIVNAFGFFLVVPAVIIVGLIITQYSKSSLVTIGDPMTLLNIILIAEIIYWYLLSCVIGYISEKLFKRFRSGKTKSLPKKKAKAKIASAGKKLKKLKIRD